MKKIILFLLFSIELFPTFYFQTHKTDRNFITGELRLDFLFELKQVFQAPIFIETGTYQGKTSINASKIFNMVYTTELHPDRYKQALEIIKRYQNIHFYNYHSADFIETISFLASDRVIFWLDAHYSGPQTAYSNSDSTKESAMTPIREELVSIKNNNYSESIVLIDDARLFGSQESNKEMQSYWGYPSIQEVCKLLLDINHEFNFALIGDTLMAYDRKFTVGLSPIVQACTMSRLYDGSNYSDEELLNAEKTIMGAQGAEHLLISVLNHVLQNIESLQIYHYALWKGLTCLNTNSLEAYTLFKMILEKYNYQHWRIKWYVVQAAIKLNKKEEALNYLRELIEESDYPFIKECYYNLSHEFQISD